MPRFDPALDDALASFFAAPHTGATTHEEWLFRMCAQLMHREASVVSFMEHQASSAATAVPACPPPFQPSNASEASTNPSTGTDATP